MNGKVVTSAQELRRLRIITGIDRATSGIEYGPLHRVVMTREMCPGVRYVDYKPREQLMAHYQNNPNVDVSLIPEIDIVTGGRQITEFVPEESIDFAIASHVMEHVPDVIGWLEANLRLLRPGGRIALAFPDRRFCFDLAKQPTSFHEMVAAYLEKRTKPSFTQICDHVLNERKVSAIDVWSGSLNEKNSIPLHALPQALSILRTLVNKKEYHDVHCWKFSDHEFMGMLEEIKYNFQLPFELLSFFPTQKNSLEFYATLIRV